MGQKLSEEEARMIMLKASLLPKGAYINGSTLWECNCMRCGRTVHHKASQTKNRRSSCKYCSGNTLDFKSAIEIMKKAGAYPLVKRPKKTTDPWKSLCLDCYRVITPRYNDVQKGNHCPCKYCSNHDVPIEERLKVMSRANLKPLVDYPGSCMTNWKSECLDCERIVHPRYNNVQQGNGGCKYCSPAGFDVTKLGRVYIISNKNDSIRKIGISNVYKKRLRQHELQGLSNLILLTKEISGQFAKDIEQSWINYLRSEGIPPAETTLRYAGVSETWQTERCEDFPIFSPDIVDIDNRTDSCYD